MGLLAWALCLIGLLVCLAGTIIFLVAAFRESIWWGLGSMFVPFVSLFFLIKYWAEAKNGFLISLLGCIVMVGGSFLGGFGAAQNGAGSEGFSFTFDQPGDSTSGGDSTDAQPTVSPLLEHEQVITSELQSLSSELRSSEERYRELTTELTTRYQEIEKLKAALDETDIQSVAAFRDKVETYKRLHAESKALTMRIPALQERLRAKMSEDPPIVRVAAQPSAGAPAGGAGQVIIYSTASCGYCVKAKDYFRSRGVPYVEYDINNNPEARAQFAAYGGRGVPLVVINGKVIKGYSPAAFDEAL